MTGAEWINRIHEGDARTVLDALPESSIHCVMTSPPYWNLRDYHVEGQIGLESSVVEYVDQLVTVGRKIRRVLRDDGSWWLNLGDSFAGSGGAGGQWTDDHSGSAQYAGTAGDAANGALTDTSFTRKTKLLVPHRIAIALINDGWIVRSDAVWAKPNPLPHPVKDRLHEHKEYLFHLTPAPEYWFNLDAIREPHKKASFDRDRHPYTSAGGDQQPARTRTGPTLPSTRPPHCTQTERIQATLSRSPLNHSQRHIRRCIPLNCVTCRLRLPAPPRSVLTAGARMSERLTRSQLRRSIRPDRSRNGRWNSQSKQG